ncbi:hypothetical protein [Ferrimonas balearica]|uniref:hypothetical protein n=1 Tax=Ferrimonas balearica TaxID=44012 RepID=UPI001C99DBD4|nr:hypothetical protein [Ferrimonas balearica]MBY5992051.1 hypothetical protein [Ferrimonas balearica]
MKRHLHLLLGAASLLPMTAAAYVGPGTGLSALGTVVAFLVAIVLLLFGFIWYPVKRLMARARQKPVAAQEAPVAESQASDEPEQQ